MSATRLAATIAALLAAGALGCQSKPDFESCQMTSSMLSDCESTCAESDIQCFQTCVVKDHPQCVEGPCVLFQYRQTNMEQPWNSTGPFCSLPCNGEACPADSTCLAVLALKKACTTDADCETVSPWARCEPPRHCATTRKECEVAADCAAGEACTPDTGDGVAKSCSWKLCVPDDYKPAK